jgi:hypothetical protein
MANMCNLFSPIIPDGCKVLQGMLKIHDLSWKPINVVKDLVIDEVKVLYNRI